LLEAKTVSFYLNPIEAMQGKYSIRGLADRLTAKPHLKIDEQVKQFYHIKETENR